MYLTISSVLTTVFLCSILILILCGLFKNNSFATKVGPGCMIGLLLAVLVRMLVPFEFFYTYSVYIDDVLSPVLQFFIYPVYEGEVVITVWHIIVICVAIGSILLISREFFFYKRLCHYVKVLEEIQLETLCEKYRLEREKFGMIPNVKIVMLDEVKTPYLIGLRKPCVVLPNIEYNKQQLYYILQHEFMHIRKHDIVWKVLIDLLCTAFWWNPVFWYLKKELFQMIEMRNDSQLTSNMTSEEQIEYMECLRDMVAKTAGKSVAFSVSFSKNNMKELKRRLLMIATDNKMKRGLQVCMVILMACLLFASSMIIIEPRNRIEDESIGIPITSENSFLIRNGDTYDVYVDGVYLFNTDDLRPFQGVNIYDSIEEVEEND